MTIRKALCRAPIAPALLWAFSQSAAWAANAPTVTLNVDPKRITQGDTATLSWTSTGASSCSMSGAWTGNVPLQSSTTNPPTVKPPDSGKDSYTLTCAGPGGSASQTVTLWVAAAPAPTVTIAVTPATIALGQTATLAWTSANATACSMSSALSGAVPLQSNAGNPPKVQPSAIGGYNYTLSCSGAGGSSSQTAKLTVNAPPAPTVTIAASPKSITLGDSATLSWTSTNADSCSMSGDWTGDVPLQSNPDHPPSVKPSASGRATYTLTCSGAGGSAKRSASVQVSAAPPPTISIAIDPQSMPLGNTATLTWHSSNATSCAISGALNHAVGLQSSDSNPLTVKPTVSGIYDYTLTCSGAGGSTPATAELRVLSPLDLRIQAAQQTAGNTDPESSCGAISRNQSGINNGFYWEIGDENGIIGDTTMGLSASGSVQPPGTDGDNYTRSSQLFLDSATKWMYASYVSELKAQWNGSTWQMPRRYVPFLNFTSGYDNMSDNCSYDVSPTVQDCLDLGNDNTPPLANGTLNSDDVGHFYYDSGHLEVLEAGAAPSLTGYMSGGDNTVLALGNELTSTFAAKNVNLNLSFVSPILAGGILTTPGDYASFLQGILRTNSPLVMKALLNPVAKDPYAVCTSPNDPDCVDSSGNPLARFSPLPYSVLWHYGIGHWIEDDPETGDGAYSSPGKGGFYPWIDSTKTYYGIVARYDPMTAITPNTAPFYMSVVCGEAIRKAFMTGTVQP